MEIYGLNDRQRKIADLLWSMNTTEEVRKFINGLSGDVTRDAQVVLAMMIAAVLDDVTDITEAEQVLERFK